MSRVLTKGPLLFNRTGILLSKSGQCRGTAYNGYLILLPEIPPDTTPETNPLLRTIENPVFEEIHKRSCRNAVGKLGLDLEARVWRLEESLKDPSFAKTYENVIGPLEEISIPFDFAWGIVKSLNVAKTDFIHSEGYTQIHGRARKSRRSKFQSLPVYLACKEIMADSQKLNESQRRVVAKYLLEGRLSGIELTGDQKIHLEDTQKNISEAQFHFKNNLNITTEKFKQLLIDPKYVGDMPSYLLKHLAKDKSQPSKGPWTVTLNSPVYESFTEYCPERALRWNTWQAYNIRASGFTDKTFSNSTHIEELRIKRKDQATLLGFDNYVDLSMETKMAGSVYNVQSMIATLLKEAKPIQLEELETLKQFAASRGFTSTLRQWDIPYWRRKHRKSLFEVDDALISEYFPFPGIWANLCSFAEDLFEIKIKRTQASTWNEDVSYFEVFDAKSEQKLGGFYVDPYSRNEQKLTGSWMMPVRNLCQKSEVLPLATLIFNFNPPLYGKPCLLSYSDVYVLFEKFGQVLQQVLTTVPYHEVSGTTNIEWDAVHVASKFMSIWLGNKEAVKQISTHYETQDKIPDDMMRNLLRSRKHMAAFDLCHELYISALDLELHLSNDFWVDIMKKLWPVYHSPLELDKKDAHVCGFEQLFSGDFSAAYYSHLWSRMLAADSYQAFIEQVPRKSDTWKQHGVRFRTSFLSWGGGRHPSQVFRDFRGRDPCPDALLWSLGLKPLHAEEDKVTIGKSEAAAESVSTQ